MPALPIRDLDHVLEHAGPGVWKALAGKRLLITGGTGFVGTWLLESLLWATERLDLATSVVVLTRDPGRFRKRSPHLAEHPTVELLAGSVQDFAFPAGEFPFVVHAATERYFEPDRAHPASAFDQDVAGTRRVLEFASAHRTRRLLFTSSGAVYGPQPSELTHIPEDYPGAPPTTGPGTAYGQAKRVSEFLCAMYAREFGFDVLIARLFAFAGPLLPLDANYAVGNFVGDAIQERPVRVKGDGTPYRSYLYAADLAVWLWTILVRGESGRPYNVGSSEAITIADLAGTVARATTNTPVEIAEKAVPGGQAARYVPSVERARTELALQPVIPLDEGIRRTYEWARKAADDGSRGEEEPGHEHEWGFPRGAGESLRRR